MLKGAYMQKDDCLFCQFVEGKIPCHKVWEDDLHIAFLTIFPNTKGFTVVATKNHYPSDAFSQDDTLITGLVLACKTVAKKINAAFEDVGRTGMFLEGFGVNHLHAKLFPMHGTKGVELWREMPPERVTKKFFTRYEGYLSSHNGERADDKKLEEIAKKIRES